MKVQMGSKRMDHEFRAAWPIIHQSLHCGDSVLVHCMAGKHRAPACTALIYALMMGVSVDEAAEKITKMRPCVEFHNVLPRSHGGAVAVQDWAHFVIATSAPSAGWISCFGSFKHPPVH